MSTDSPNTPQLLGLAERTENDGNKPPRSLTLDMENVDLTASAVPSHVQLENKMLGKMANSPRVGLPAVKACNDITTMSAYPPGYDENGKIVDGDSGASEARTLPLSERLVSKAWKDRKGAYEELKGLFESSNDVSIFDEYAPCIVPCATDKFPMCLAEGLAAATAFILHRKAVGVEPSTERLAQAALDAFKQSKTNIIRAASSLLLLMIDQTAPKSEERADLVTAIVNRAHTAKNVKIATQSVAILTQAVDKYGIPGIPLAPILKGLTGILESAHASAKKQGVQLVVSIHSHTKSTAMFNLGALKQAMQKEIKDAISAMDAGPSLQPDLEGNGCSTGRNDAAPAAPMKKEPATRNISDAQAAIVSLSVWEALPATDVSDKIAPFLATALKREEKWKVRKTALDTAIEICSTGAMRFNPDTTDFFAAYDCIKVCLQDTTLWIRICGMKLAKAFALGGRRDKFGTQAKKLSRILIEWYKEKKTVHANAISECLDTFHYAGVVSLEDIFEDCIVKKITSDANPNVVESTMRFVARAIEATTVSPTPLDAHIFVSAHPFVQSLLHVSTNVGATGRTPAIREAAQECIAALLHKLTRTDPRIDSVLKDFKISNKPLYNKFTGEDEKCVQKSNQTRGSVTEVSDSAAASKPNRRVSRERGSPKKVTIPKSRASHMDGEATASLISAEEAMNRLDTLGLANWADTKVLLASSKWQEVKRGLEIVQETLVAKPEIIDNHSEAVIVTLGQTTKGFTHKNFNIMNAAFDTLTALADLCVEQSKCFPLQTLKAFVPFVSAKFGDRKMATRLHAMLLSVSQCVTPTQVVSRVCHAATKDLKSPVQFEDVLTFLGTVADEFDVSILPANAMLAFVAGEKGLGNKNPKIKSKSEGLITAWYKKSASLSTKVLAALADCDAPRSDGLIASLQAMKVEFSEDSSSGSRKVNIAANPAVAAAHAAALEDETKVSKVDVTGMVSKELFGDLHADVDKKSWLTRQNAVGSIHKIIDGIRGTRGCVECNKESCRVMVELRKALKNESNKHTRVKIAATMTLMVQKIGVDVTKIARFIIKDILPVLADTTNKLLVEEVVNFLNNWCEHASVNANAPVVSPACVDSVLQFLPDFMRSKECKLNANLAVWMERFLPFATNVKYLEALLPCIFEFCQAKNSSTRNAAESVLKAIHDICGPGVVADGFAKDLHGAAKRSVQSIYDRVMNGQNAAPTSSSTTTKPLVARRRASASSATETTKKTLLVKTNPSRRASATATLANATDKPTENVDEMELELLKVMPDKMKARRAADASRRPWVLPDRPEAPAEDLVEKLRMDMEQAAAPGGKFFNYAFSTSSSLKLGHIGRACDMLKHAVIKGTAQGAILSNLDLILKWSTLYLDLKQASVVKSLQAMLLALLEMLKMEEYELTEYEVSVFLPCLALHVGHKVPRFCSNYRSMMRLVSEIHSPVKCAQFIIYGIDPRAIRNSISRKNNLEEVTRLIIEHGTEVVGGSKGLQTIASQIDSKENEIRSAALNAVCAVWEKLGRDTTKLMKNIGKALKGKGDAILKERLKAKGGDISVPPAPETNSAKGTTVAKPAAKPRKSAKERTTLIMDQISNMQKSIRSPATSPSATDREKERSQRDVDVEALLRGLVPSEAHDDGEDCFAMDFDLGKIGIDEVNRQLHNISLGLADSPTKPSVPDLPVKDEEDTTREKVVKMMAVLDNWVDMAAGLSVVPADINDACATAVKEFNSLVFPDHSYQAAKDEDVFEISQVIPGVVTRFCQVLERCFQRRQVKTDEGVAPWLEHERIITNVLVSLGAVAELKPLARKIPIDGFRAMMRVSIQAMEDISSAKSGGMQFNIDFTSAFNDFAQRMIAHCDRTVVLQSLVGLFVDGDSLKRFGFNLVKRMIEKALKRELKDPYLNRGGRPFAKVDVSRVLEMCNDVQTSIEVGMELPETDGIALEAIKQVLTTSIEHSTMKGKGAQWREGINIPDGTTVFMLIDALVAPPSASVAPIAPPVETVVPPEDAHDEALRKIFAKISSKESHDGVRELHEFKKEYPGVDTDPYMQKASLTFQKFITNQLKRLKASDDMKSAGVTISIDEQPAGSGRSSMPTTKRNSSADTISEMKARLAKYSSAAAGVSAVRAGDVTTVTNGRHSTDGVIASDVRVTATSMSATDTSTKPMAVIASYRERLAMIQKQQKASKD